MKAYEAGAAQMKPGVALSNVYQTIYDKLNEFDENLASNLSSSAGFGIGLEFRESTLSIKANNKTIIEEGMVMFFYIFHLFY